MGKLTPVQLRATPFHPCIGRTFEEINAVLTRETHDVLHGKDKRIIDQAVDHQAMIFGGNLGHPAVMALKAKTIGGDDAIKLMQRREIDR